MLDTVKPSHRSESSLAGATSGMISSMNKSDDIVDLSERNPETYASPMLLNFGGSFTIYMFIRISHRYTL